MKITTGSFSVFLKEDFGSSWSIQKNNGEYGYPILMFGTEIGGEYSDAKIHKLMGYNNQRFCIVVSEYEDFLEHDNTRNWNEWEEIFDFLKYSNTKEIK